MLSKEDSFSTYWKKKKTWCLGYGSFCLIPYIMKKKDVVAALHQFSIPFLLHLYIGRKEKCSLSRKFLIPGLFIGSSDAAEHF